MIALQIVISFICLLYIISTIYIGYKCCIELKDWSFSKVIFSMVLFILNLVNVIILINIWTI